MKCYFRLGDDEWVKGHIYSLHGNREIHFTSEPNGIVKEFYIINPEIGFFSRYFCLTGYMPVEDKGCYQVVSVDVSGGWVKPKK